MSQDNRKRAIETFREKKACQIMICNLKCGGSGLNLTMASRAILIDSWFNRPVENQGDCHPLTTSRTDVDAHTAFCRIFRFGQEKECEVVRIVCRNSVDQKLEQMGRQKEEAISASIGENGLRLAALTVEEMKRLFDPFYEDGTPKKDGFLYVDEPKGDNDALI